MITLHSGGHAWWRPSGEKPPCFPRNYPEMAVEVKSVNPERGTALIEFVDNPSRLTRSKRLVGIAELVPVDFTGVRRGS